MKDDNTSPTGKQRARPIIVDDGTIQRPYVPPKPPTRAQVEPTGHRAWLVLIIPLIVMVLLLWLVLFVKAMGGH